MNAVTINRINQDGVLSVVRIMRSTEGEIARLNARAVRLETEDAVANRQKPIHYLTTGWALELLYPGGAAIGAIALAQTEGKMVLLPYLEDYKSEYGDYKMLPSTVFKVNSEKAALLPAAKDVALAEKYRIPKDIFLIVSCSGVHLRTVNGEAGPGWIMTKDELVASFRLAPVEQPKKG
jgi:hypothetical protein